MIRRLGVDHGVQQRPLNVGDIEYFFIPSVRPEFNHPIFPPPDFESPVFQLLRILPKNLTQLNDPFVHFGESKRVQSVTPHRFSVFYPDSIEMMIAANPYKTNLKVFIIDPDVAALGEMIKRLRSQFSFSYFVNAKSPDKTIKGQETLLITSAQDFMAVLKKQKVRIEALLLEEFPKVQIEFKIDLPLTEYHHLYNPQNEFKASHSNFWTLNQILGNGWASNDLLTSDEAISRGKKNIKKNPHDTYRLQILVDQVKRFDELEIIVSQDRKIKYPNGHQDVCSPLVVVLPFNFPNLTKIFDPSLGKDKLKALTRILNVEQELNYIVYSPKATTNKDDVLAYGKVLASKTDYLDGVAYLHASFENSPIVRFPALGNSIRKELSFFKPEALNDTKWRKSKELIDTFGDKLKKLVIGETLDKELFMVPRQVIAITDLPIEWMHYDGKSLCLSRDVARIPETPYGGSLASFTVHSNLVMSIGQDIINKTLVLFGATSEEGDDEEMGFHFKTIERLADRYGYKTAKCNSIDDVVREIEAYQPHFLIFDCHGGFDTDTISSYLIINDEKITGSDIVKRKITAPLVFLSACFTNPNYGYLGKIADAFFEIGCFSVTATYFPVSVRSATTIYLRLLRNLAFAAKSPMHKNWLEFLSHVIRTSFFKDVLNKTQINVVRSKLGDEQKKTIIENIRQFDVDFSLHLLRTQDRNLYIEGFEVRLAEICPKELIDRTTVPEYCFYTHMGRPDLVRFEAWTDKFTSLNNLNQGK